MDGRYAEDIATGAPFGQRLRIAGRPREGAEERYVILEEPGDPVLTHFHGRLLPHFKRDCPHCRGDQPKPLWYVGASSLGGELVILELTWKCYQSAAAAARTLADRRSPDLFGEEIDVVGNTFTRLLVRVSRANFKSSQRVLRCDQRVKRSEPWPYRTREELARIWGIPMRPRLFRAEEA
jgi:hypothetical protein